MPSISSPYESHSRSSGVTIVLDFCFPPSPGRGRPGRAGMPPPPEPPASPLRLRVDGSSSDDRALLQRSLPDRGPLPPSAATRGQTSSRIAALVDTCTVMVPIRLFSSFRSNSAESLSLRRSSRSLLSASLSSSCLFISSRCSASRSFTASLSSLRRLFSDRSRSCSRNTRFIFSMESNSALFSSLTSSRRRSMVSRSRVDEDDVPWTALLKPAPNGSLRRASSSSCPIGLA
mmetsp:Transcript_51058/g.153469  ORF Transcript_51058/g.153469 Transcript_51058/m.153469 type:complete len:232 (-) Transcript_51058:698-1393(-)